MRRLRIVVLLPILLSLVVSAQCAIIHVRTDGSDGDGSTWETAKTTVAAGLNAAVSGDEVWVAKGAYVGVTTLKVGVELYGGFVGTETDLSQRPPFPRPVPDPNETTLDGNKGGTVVTSPTGATATTRIDGFTITNGVASGGGGGIYCYNSSPTIANNIIKGNSARQGGGIYCYYYNSSPVIIDNIITANSATGASPSDGGGGIYCRYGSPTISNNSIIGNSAANYGGGIYCEASGAVVSGNVIAGNSGYVGGGMVCISSSPSPTVSSNTITGNTANVASRAGGVYCKNSLAKLSNNVIAFNSSGLESYAGAPVLRNNCVYNPGGYDYSGLPAGTGDISADPLFVDKEHENYHLSSASPCIDAGWNDALGMPLFDMDGEGRIFNGTVDIGADEYWLLEMNIPSVKAAPDGVVVNVNGADAVITADSTNVFYIESIDRFSGIRVEKAGHGLKKGMKADVTGHVKINADGECYIEAETAVQNGSDLITIDPLGLSCRALGGGTFGLQQAVKDGLGLSNIGLLIKTCGKVTHAGDGFFYLDDGSALKDGSGHTGVKVYGTVPVAEGENPMGKVVSVVGISSCEEPDSEPLRIIRTRDTAGVVILR